MHAFRSSPTTWVEFNDRYAYFSSLVGNNCGLREIRYSIDSKSLDKRFPVMPYSLRNHGRMPADNSEILTLTQPA